MDIPYERLHMCWLRDLEFCSSTLNTTGWWYLNQVIYLNLVCWADLEHLDNLALGYLGFLSYLLQKTSKNGDF